MLYDYIQECEILLKPNQPSEVNQPSRDDYIRAMKMLRKARFNALNLINEFDLTSYFWDAELEMKIIMMLRRLYWITRILWEFNRYFISLPRNSILMRNNCNDIDPHLIKCTYSLLIITKENTTHVPIFSKFSLFGDANLFTTYDMLLQIGPIHFKFVTEDGYGKTS